MGIRVLALLLVAGCATATEGTTHAASPEPTTPLERSGARDPAAAPPEGAPCGDARCAANELCVAQGFCSGIRLPEPGERGVRYQCVPITPSCAEAPTCGCAGDVCQWGGCAGIEAGNVLCVCG